MRLPLVSPLDRILFLKAQPYLRGQPPDVLTVLGSYTQEQTYRSRGLIRPGGQPVERICFLGEGRVELTMDDGGTKVVEAPGVIGLAHHFAGTKSAPEVRALEPTLCLELAVGDLDQILEDHFTLLHQFARRGGEEAVKALRALRHARPEERGFDEEDLDETPARLDLVHRLARARRAPLFHDINLTVLGQLLRPESPRVIREGDAIWKQGDRVEGMALVLDGRFRTDGPFDAGRARSGSTLGAWEVLGEGARQEGWIAETPSRVLWIARELFIDILEDHHEFAQAYLRRSSEVMIEGWQALAANGAGRAVEG